MRTAADRSYAQERIRTSCFTTEDTEMPDAA